MFKKFLWGLHTFFFVFSPLYFLLHLLFNVLGITNPFLLLACSLSMIWFATLHTPFEEIDAIEISKISSISLFLGTLLLTFITLKVGIDDSTDSYFYHLNSTIPIALFHDVLNTHLFDLIGFSQGYPKFGEFLQALFINLTDQFWSYGLTSVLVIPASYTTSFLLAKKLGLSHPSADAVALCYAFNPINVAQATTGYVDSTLSLYALGSILFAFKVVHFRHFILLLLNLIALLNIKLTGISMSIMILGFSVLWNRKFLAQDWMSYLFAATALYFIGFFHYLVNFIHYGTFIFPFIDFEFAKYTSQIYIGFEDLGHKIITLFWSIPQPFAHISQYDARQGALSPLWYPLPLFMGLALVKALKIKDKGFLTIQALLWTLLLIDPVISSARYVAYFQLAGFLASFYLLPPHILPWIRYVLPLAYLSLGNYIIFNQELGTLKRRLVYYEQNRLLLESIESTSRRAFNYYYDLNSFCSGYYWLLRYKQLDVQLLQDQPHGENYFYLYRNAQGQCAVTLNHNLNTQTYAYQLNDTPYLDITVTTPSALEYCKQCISEYGCSYIPFYVHKHTQNLSDTFLFKTEGEKELTLECQSIDGKNIKETFKFHAKGQSSSH